MPHFGALLGPLGAILEGGLLGRLELTEARKRENPKTNEKPEENHWFLLLRALQRLLLEPSRAVLGGSLTHLGPSWGHRDRRGGGPLEDYRNPARQHLAFFHASTCQGARWRIPGAPKECAVSVHPDVFASLGNTGGRRRELLGYHLPWRVYRTVPRFSTWLPPS